MDAVNECLRNQQPKVVKGKPQTDFICFNIANTTVKTFFDMQDNMRTWQLNKPNFSFMYDLFNIKATSEFIKATKKSG